MRQNVLTSETEQLLRMLFVAYELRIEKNASVNSHEHSRIILNTGRGGFLFQDVNIFCVAVGGGVCFVFVWVFCLFFLMGRLCNFCYDNGSGVGMNLIFKPDSSSCVRNCSFWHLGLV